MSPQGNSLGESAVAWKFSLLINFPLVVAAMFFFVKRGWKKKGISFFCFFPHHKFCLYLSNIINSKPFYLSVCLIDSETSNSSRLFLWWSFFPFLQTFECQSYPLKEILPFYRQGSCISSLYHWWWWWNCQKFPLCSGSWFWRRWPPPPALWSWSYQRLATTCRCDKEAELGPKLWLVAKYSIRLGRPVWH